MFGYLEGFTAGPDLEKNVKRYKKIATYMSHHKISTNITSDDVRTLLCGYMHAVMVHYMPK